MASVAFPRFLSLQLVPCRCTCSTPRRNQRIRSFSATKCENSTAVLWFKHDLRIDDHPGLVAASEFGALVPLYVFDDRIVSRFPDEKLELVLLAVEDLRKSLKEEGSNLMIKFGKVEHVIKDLVREVQATTVFAEEEVEYHLCNVVDNVKKTMETLSSPEEQLTFELWRTPFYDVKNLKDLPVSYDDFKKLKLQITSPIPYPSLPDPLAWSELQWGPLPTFSDVKEFIYQNSCKSKHTCWTAVKEMSAESILQVRLSRSRKEDVNDSNVKHTPRKRLDKSVFITQKDNIVAGGTKMVLDALAAYLRYLEGTSRDDWQEVHERLLESESRDGSSFATLFGPALSLGIISRRRVHYEAIKYEKERNAGYLSPFGYSAATVTAAADTVCSMEWYWLLALKNQASDKEPYCIKTWRWRGYLIQYAVDADKGPAILLVHGFGAFLEHYRDNIHGIAKHGNRVWAITVLGFGKSEKPNLVYTELMWAELLRDFIAEVVCEPVHLVGNSIGGYFVALVASLWPSLVRSAVLVNSAGNVNRGYYSLQPSKKRQASGATWFGARLLLFYLRLNTKNLLTKCYPTRPERADGWLVGEMLRASHDPGVVVVLESIFSFDLSLPLNYLLEGFTDKVLIIQGMKDPISDSKSRVAMLKEVCADIVIRELDAGHCPHDELPEKVNSVICNWIVNINSRAAV